MKQRNFLLDSHVLLWALDAPKKLRPAARKILESSDSKLFFSTAGLWELAIKASLGKMMPIDAAFVAMLDTQGIQLLAIKPSHIFALNQLPHHHRDPFDRIMIAQAKIEEMQIITGDGIIERYDVAIVKA